MDPTTTSLSTGSASSTSVPERGLAQTCVLLGGGALLALGHRAWDVDFGLPGHYGLVWMAGVVIARRWSARRWAALTTAAGYMGAITLLAHGAGAATQAPIYGLCGLALDLAWLAGLRDRPRLAPLALVGGLAFMLKPLAVYAVAHIMHLTLGKLRYGLLFPAITHFAFGAVGAVIGSLLHGLGQRARRGEQD